MIFFALALVALVLFLVFSSRRKEPVPAPPITVTSMSSDDFVEFALGIIAEKEAAERRRQSRGDPWAGVD